MADKILIIDDDPLSLRLAEHVLKDDYIVQCARSGAQGLAMIAQEIPALVILDMVMPGMDGLEVLAMLRQNERTADIKAVFLTGSLSTEDKRRASDLGALDFIRKPFSAVEFSARIKHAMEAPRRDSILIVDDDRISLMLAKKPLEDRYDITCATSAKEALSILQHRVPSLLLLDLHMPDIDGLELVHLLHSQPATAQLPVIFLTADTDHDTEVSILRAGASDFIRKPFVGEVARCRVEHAIELYHYQTSLQHEISRKTDSLRESNARLESLSMQIMMTLADAIDAKDAYTKGHSQRVAAYSREIARRMGKSAQEVDDIYNIGLLHDIGKIGVPTTIIKKPSRLTNEEYDIIRQHPAIGAKILENITQIPNIAVGAHWHHERYDGKGYPDGLKGEEIPEIARIICVADAYDSMTSKRSYRDVLSQEVVRQEIERGMGTQFDPKIAKYMLEMIDDDVNYHMHEQ